MLNIIYGKNPGHHGEISVMRSGRIIKFVRTKWSFFELLFLRVHVIKFVPCNIICKQS